MNDEVKEPQENKGGVKSPEKSGTESIKQWRIIEESEITPDDSERIQRMGDFMLRFAKNYNKEERDEILRGTDLSVEVGRDWHIEGDIYVEKENPDYMVNLVAKDGRRLSRLFWGSSGELTVDLMYPDSGPFVKIEVPEGMSTQEAVDTYSAGIEYQIMLTTKWLKDAENSIHQNIEKLGKTLPSS